ncbi:MULTISPECIES: cupin domain-containing protein [unclassified Brachybacterium]|uniref:cupin domain-containing protein n=1 Tax=unclassified Brachybacterium TaxID=2623841 RepID=UPI000C80A877|nr:MULTISPECIES: cupin domain-containing protein [unclassified Brachybacterium]PMC76164.1 cupin domain-containing protein [Brachybacterium sp. UMB0905]
MAVTDNGPQPNAFDIETETRSNDAYRTVAWTGKYLQVTLMSIPVGGSIGLEIHHDTDQFLRVDAGKGRAVMGPAEDQLDYQQDLEDGWSVQVPAGVWHDVINTGDEPLRLYSVYAPVHHAPGIVQQTAEIAELDETSGKDEPPSWSVQPPAQKPDEHA